MAIGFMSFGGMLTGGDEEGAKEEKTAKVEDSKEDLEKAKEIANNIKVNE